MNSKHRWLFGPETGEEERVRVGLDRRVVGHVDLLEIRVGHKLAEVPEWDGAVDGGRGEDVVVAREDERGDHGGVVRKVAQQVAVGDVPEQDAVIAATGSQKPPVVGEVDGGNGAFVAGHQADAVPGDAVPQTQAPITGPWNWGLITEKIGPRQHIFLKATRLEPIEKGSIIFSYESHRLVSVLDERQY